VRRAALLVAGAAALAWSVGAAGEPGAVREVTMPGKVYAPARLAVLVGDTVVWRNADAGNHTVTADEEPFDSGTLAPGATFAHTFTRQGRYAYHCTIHKFMRGEVAVYGLVLTAPEAPVAAGARVVFRGLAPAGAGSVALERLRAERRWRAKPLANGSFSFTVVLQEPAAFVARAGGVASPTVRVRVAPRVTLRRAGSSLSVSAVPVRPRARVAIQVYDRERFAWRTVTRGRLDEQSRARLPYRWRSPAHVRALVRGGRGWADGASRALVVR
jgi:plastocyanin